MNSEINDFIISKFEDKHKVKRVKNVSEDVIKFDDGRYYSFDDIRFDLGENIPVGQIENYSDIGTDSAISVPFKTWYKLKHK